MTGAFFNGAQRKKYWRVNFFIYNRTNTKHLDGNHMFGKSGGWTDAIDKIEAGDVMEK